LKFANFGFFKEQDFAKEDIEYPERNVLVVTMKISKLINYLTNVCASCQGTMGTHLIFSAFSTNGFVS
jgi:hypothetical protein